MKIVVMAVGRPERGRFGPLFDEYAVRIRTLGASFESRSVPEVKAGGRFSDRHVREREAQAIRDALPARCNLIALSPEGRVLDTPAFAEQLSRWSHPLAMFVIGGPLGLDPELRAAAAACVSLSAMTFPHELARLMLAEQIYRAMTLLRGVPYHK